MLLLQLYNKHKNLKPFKNLFLLEKILKKIYPLLKLFKTANQTNFLLKNILMLRKRNSGDIESWIFADRTYAYSNSQILKILKN